MMPKPLVPSVAPGWPKRGVFEAWNGLFEGLLAVHDRFLVLDVRRRLDRGDAAFEWEVRPRGRTGAF